VRILNLRKVAAGFPALTNQVSSLRRFVRCHPGTRPATTNWL
jgi:hypothetical protein